MDGSERGGGRERKRQPRRAVCGAIARGPMRAKDAGSYARPRRFAFLLLCIQALLLGCSHPPSDENLRDAQRDELLRTRFIAEGMMNRVNATRILACAKSDLDSYVCDILVPGQGIKKIRMVRSADKCEVVKV